MKLSVVLWPLAGDMLSVDGDADAAVDTRIRTAWNKFSQLVVGRDKNGQMDMLQDRVPSKGLREKLGLDDIISVLQQKRL